MPNRLRLLMDEACENCLLDCPAVILDTIPTCPLIIQTLEETTS